MEQLALKHLRELGVKIERVNERKIEEIAPLSYRGF